MRYELTVLPTSFMMEVIDKSGASCLRVIKTIPTQRQVRATIKQGKKQLNEFFNG